MERGERERVRVVFQVEERVKVVPRREDWGEADAEVVVEEAIVESVEDWVVCALLGWLRVVDKERRRAVKGEGKGGGTRLMVVEVGDDGDINSSMVVSKPSKKWIRSGTALVKVSTGMGGRSMVLLGLPDICIM
jgi:hypothetical protein